MGLSLQDAGRPPRQQLGLLAETIFSLDGLDYPPVAATGNTAYSAAELCLQTYRRRRPGFDGVFIDAHSQDRWIEEVVIKQS